jgi:serine/threonine-protein kinase HipA
MLTSDDSSCYVYIQLPESMEVVTCGRFVQQGDVGRFVYGRSYLSNPRAVELEKFELPLRPGTFETARCGGTEADVKAIERAFDYEGFEYGSTR